MHSQNDFLPPCSSPSPQINITEMKMEDSETWLAKKPRRECSQVGEASCSQPLLKADAPQLAEVRSVNKDAGQEQPSCSIKRDYNGEDEEGTTNYVVKRMETFLSHTEPYILDIDLDFFSCKNPFKELYTEVPMAFNFHFVFVVVLLEADL